MCVTVVPNRGSPPAILLCETYREDGKVKNRTLANISKWKPEKSFARHYTSEPGWVSAGMCCSARNMKTPVAGIRLARFGS
jgi:hypothetical protein